MGALQLPTEGGYGQRNTEKPRSPPVGMEMNLEKKKEGSRPLRIGDRHGIPTLETVSPLREIRGLSLIHI